MTAGERAVAEFLRSTGMSISASQKAMLAAAFDSERSAARREGAEEERRAILALSAPEGVIFRRDVYGRGGTGGVSK
jgi:hypothetical protein